MKIKDDFALDEARQRRCCEWCRKAGPVEAAHAIARGQGGGRQMDLRWNVASLCRLCHQMLHDGNTPPGREREPEGFNLFTLIARREKVDVEDMQEALWLISRLHRPSPWELEREVGQVKAAVGFLALRMLLTAGALEVAA